MVAIGSTIAKQALNTYLEPEQKAQLEQLAKRRNVSQATLVRQAIEEFVQRQQGAEPGQSVRAAWDRLLGGYYKGDGRANDPDDIYGRTGASFSWTLGRTERSRTGAIHTMNVRDTGCGRFSSVRLL